ncbi:ultraviolet-B receptor UVR8-like isoform X3 [Pistacia vera]|uniref:ultraviolet-B receptor UVR8-like isoform X3 n=1 Tax=Pistacia vera TaxID=55513 RepID=UPI001262E4EF|nr:ultraviolet-B receptor UVR8-like isoform X3 [Pistacia vera]
MIRPSIFLSQNYCYKTRLFVYRFIQFRLQNANLSYLQNQTSSSVYFLVIFRTSFVEMEMNGNKREEDVKMEESKETVVYMWGYLPGISTEKSPILSPTPVRLHGDDAWKDVCGGGCGFSLAISKSGKLITWGSTDEEGQSYLTSGKHGETPEPFLLPTEASVVHAAAGWAHCVSVTDTGEVYTWGWKECVPSAKVARDLTTGGSSQKDVMGKQSGSLTEQVSPKSEGSNVNGGTQSQFDNKSAGEEVAKRRKTSSPREESESSTCDDFFTVSPSAVTLNPGVKITMVAAGGRHTLVLSDMGQVWGWGYGGEGQLGLGSRIKMVSTPHLVPCIESAASAKDRSLIVRQGSMNPSAQVSKVAGTYVKGIACGGRHSALLTDAGALLTFGWGLYGQCGHGSTNDVLRPTCVSSLTGVQVEKIAAGLWHTMCISVEGRVYVFGGNQFGQLGTGADHAETIPRLLDAPILESKRAKVVSCGARHSAMLTEDGQVLGWGWNKYGQLGLGDSIDRNIPSLVPIDGFLPQNVACGWWHTLLLGETQL